MTWHQAATSLVRVQRQHAIYSSLHSWWFACFQTTCFNVYNPAGFRAEHGGCIQALDAVTYQASFPGYNTIDFPGSTLQLRFQTSICWKSHYMISQKSIMMSNWSSAPSLRTINSIPFSPTIQHTIYPSLTLLWSSFCDVSGLPFTSANVISAALLVLRWLNGNLSPLVARCPADQKNSMQNMVRWDCKHWCRPFYPCVQSFFLPSDIRYREMQA
jgi:hypothetical protein